MLSRDLAFFCGYVAVVFRTGAEPVHGFRMLAEAAESSRVRAWARRLEADSAQGFSLSASMRRSPGLFPPQLLSFVELGERTGNPGEALERLTRWSELRWEIESQLVGLGLYAALLASVSAPAITMALWYVATSGALLLSARASTLEFNPASGPLNVFLWAGLIRIDSLVNRYGLLMAGAAAIVLLLGMAFRKRLFGALLRWARASGLARSIWVAELLETLRTGLAGGQSVIQTLSLINPTSQPAYAEGLASLTRGLEEHKPLGAELGRLKWLPAHLAWHLEQSEERGELSAGLMEVRRALTDTARRYALSWQVILEPVAFIVLGAIIGFVLYLACCSVLVFLPVYTVES